MLCKTFHHPVVGPVAVNCDALDVDDLGQRMVICTTEPGSERSASTSPADATGYNSSEKSAVSHRSGRKVNNTLACPSMDLMNCRPPSSPR